MRTLFYYTAPHWSSSARAFAVAARGLAARGEAVTVVTREGAPTSEGFVSEGVSVVPLPIGDSVARDAWRLRPLLKEKFIEAVFLHTEREQLIASSAMRLAERGSVIRRIPAGLVPSGNSGKWAARLASSRLLFSTEADRVRAGAAPSSYVAPLGIDTALVEHARASARSMLGVNDAVQLIVCAVDGANGTRVTTAMRTLAVLAERHDALRLVLVGRAADPDDIRMHAAALGVASLVTLLGPRVDAPEILAAADVGWVAADGDDGAFACLDFMGAGIPIVAERVPLVSHYVPDGIAGILLPPADPSDTASAVARFLNDEQKRVAMGNAGRTRAKRDFGEKAMLDGFVAAASAASDRTQWIGQ